MPVLHLLHLRFRDWIAYDEVRVMGNKPCFSKETSVSYKNEYPSGYASAGIAGGYGAAGQIGGGPSYGHAVQNAASPCAPPDSISEIDQRLNDLDATLEDLRSLSAGFGVKLQNVVMPQVANKSGSVEPPRPIVSPMATRLDKLNSEIRAQLHILHDLYERIAL